MTGLGASVPAAGDAGGIPAAGHRIGQGGARRRYSVECVKRPARRVAATGIPRSMRAASSESAATPTGSASRRTTSPRLPTLIVRLTVCTRRQGLDAGENLNEHVIGDTRSPNVDTRCLQTPR